MVGTDHEQGGIVKDRAKMINADRLRVALADSARAVLSV
jgi:hypothetical protein